MLRSTDVQCARLSPCPLSRALPTDKCLEWAPSNFSFFRFMLVLIICMWGMCMSAGALRGWEYSVLESGVTCNCEAPNAGADWKQSGPLQEQHTPNH